MFRLQINNIPHIVVNDSALLIYASWGSQLEMLMTQDPKFPRASLLAHYSNVIKGPAITDANNNQYRTFLAFQTDNQLVDTETPKGIFASLQFNSTVYRYLRWVFEYRGVLVTEDLMKALVLCATEKSSSRGKKLAAYLPDPMAILQYDWKLTKSGFKQLSYYEGNGELYKRIGVSGHVTKAPFAPELTGIQVKHAPPANELLVEQFVKPFEKHSTKISALL